MFFYRLLSDHFSMERIYISIPVSVFIFLYILLVVQNSNQRERSCFIEQFCLYLDFLTLLTTHFRKVLQMLHFFLLAKFTHHIKQISTSLQVHSNTGKGYSIPVHFVERPPWTNIPISHASPLHIKVETVFAVDGTRMCIEKFQCSTIRRYMSPCHIDVP